MTLEQMIERAQETMPCGYTIRLEVVTGAAFVELERPDGTIAHLDDGEMDVAELFSIGEKLAKDEAAR